MGGKKVAVEVNLSRTMNCGLIPGSVQGWGDGRSVISTLTVPAVAKQLALTT